MARHRNRSGKIVTTHHVIDGLQKVMPIIASWPEVQTVIPGPFKNVRTGGREFHVRVQRIDTTGVKCVAQRTGRRQELRIVTSDPQLTVGRIQQEEWGK